ncbi:glycosyltransferase [Candidatus Gottesmanbacteria bacterium]|nr:glycosyltransferase [Candidatus Gottesmanbacteria bacterium]
MPTKTWFDGFRMKRELYLGDVKITMPRIRRSKKTISAVFFNKTVFIFDENDKIVTNYHFFFALSTIMTKRKRSMKAASLSIIIPTLNEKCNILPLISQIQKNIHPKEIIVVDDNSPDKTGALVERYRHQHKDVKLIINKPRLGLTKSLQKAIDASSGIYIAWMDADFTHPPNLLPDMMMAIKNCDIVVGSWLIKGGREVRKEKLHRFFSLAINKICSQVFFSSIQAYTSGYILTKKSVLDTQPLRGNYGEYCIDFLVRNQRKQKKIVEIPITCISRVNGQSKTCPDMKTYLVNGLRYLRMVTALLINNGEKL